MNRIPVPMAKFVKAELNNALDSPPPEPKPHSAGTLAKPDKAEPNITASPPTPVTQFYAVAILVKPEKAKLNNAAVPAEDQHQPSSTKLDTALLTRTPPKPTQAKLNIFGHPIQ